jgi:replication factor A1
MKVKDIKPKSGNIDVELDIVDVSPAREFSKFGKSGRVANAIGKDDTGDVKISLWNDDVDKVKAGDKIKITNGWANEWQGEIQLSTGKFGKMEIIGKSETTTAPSHDHAKKHDSHPGGHSHPEPTPKKEYEADMEELDVEEESVGDDDF